MLWPCRRRRRRRRQTASVVFLSFSPSSTNSHSLRNILALLVLLLVSRSVRGAEAAEPLLPWAYPLSASSASSPSLLLDEAIAGSIQNVESLVFGGGEDGGIGGGDAWSGAILLTGSFRLAERNRDTAGEEEDPDGRPPPRQACFAAVLQPSREDKDVLVRLSPVGLDDADLNWERGKGSSRCDAAAVIAESGGDGEKEKGDRGLRAILLGSSSEGGFLTGLREFGSKRSMEYGFVADVKLHESHRSPPTGPDGRGSGDYDSGGAISRTPRGGNLFNGAQYQRPVALAVPIPVPIRSGGAVQGYVREADFYVALIASDETDGNYETEYSFGTARGHLDMMKDGTYVQVIGLTFKSKEQISMDMVQKMPAAGKDYPYDKTSEVLWRRTYVPDKRDDGSYPGANIAELLYANETNGAFLVIVGTTTGYGRTFGGYDNFTATVGWSASGADGYITKLNHLTGEELSPENDSNDTQWKSSARIMSQPGKIDIIHGACLDVENKYIYVVGSTTGTMDSLMKRSHSEGVPFPFVAKVSLHSLELEWKTQYATSAGMGAAATGCSPHPDGNGVYIAGTVQNGDVLHHWKDANLKTSSSGMDDVFLSLLDEDSGAVRWIRQLGTPHDDVLAGGQGGGLMVKKDGGAVLFGATTTIMGVFSSRVFVVGVSSDGEVLDDNEDTVFSFPGASVPSSKDPGESTVHDPPTLGFESGKDDGSHSDQIAIAVAAVCSLLIAGVTILCDTWPDQGREGGVGERKRDEGGEFRVVSTGEGGVAAPAEGGDIDPEKLEHMNARTRSGLFT